jgi:glycosyltransferase involved in cell wall biosynthesis
VTRRAAPRVLHVVTSDAFAGTERHVLYLTRELRALGCAAELACPPSASRLRAEAARSGIPVRPARCRPRAWLAALACEVAREPPAVLHVHDGRAAVASAVLSRLGGGVLVRTQHFTRPASLERGGLGGVASLRLHRVLNRRLEGYVAVSRSVADAALERRETGSAEVVVIAPGIEMPDETLLVAARAARAAAPQPVVAFAGRLEPERRLDVLLRAIALVREQLPGCRFPIAGSGAAERDLKRLAAELDIEDAIAWKGWVADPYAMLAGAHVYVNPWPWEGFGMAMAEAMALALPVVAVDSGASTNMVRTGVTGLLVAGGDAPALAAAIVTLARDRDLAASMGEAAREQSTALYGASATAEATLALYRRLLVPAPSERPAGRASSECDLGQPAEVRS